jgi:hypothetical protein
MLCASRCRLRVACQHGGSYRRWLPPPSKQRNPRLKDSPVRQYLLSSLRVRDPVVDNLISLYPALSEVTPDDLQLIIDPNLSLLKGLAPTDQTLTKLVCNKPRLLAVPLSSWYTFLSSYGLSDNQVWDLLDNQPGVMLQGSIYAAGKAIMFLKSLGWSDLEINLVIVPSYPHILRMDVDTDLQPILDYVLQLGLTNEVAQELLQQYPSIWCADYRRVVAGILAGSERYWSKQQHCSGRDDTNASHQQPAVAAAVQVA